MLRQSLVDADVNMRVRQFWVTLESGNASDFVLLAHLTVAAREAQLSSKINLRHPQHLLETTCFEAARGEWEAGRVEASTGEVYGLLMLSEYGYQTGRNSILWEFAHNALDTARRIEFRHTRYPWHGARLKQLPDADSCDVEYEHILTCYWSAWVRVLTAAQTTMQRLGAHLYTQRRGDDSGSMLPELTAHDMCHFTAQPVVRPGKTVLSAVEFPPMACRHQPHFAYSASLVQCSLMVAEMHDRHIDLLERRITPVAFLDALRLWDHRMCRWRACWPPEWEAQLAEMFETAYRINSSAYDNRVPLDSPPIRLYCPDGWRNRSRSSFSGAATTASAAPSELMHIGSHLFHRSQMTPADSWLTILLAMCETARLRMHRVALALLRRRRPYSSVICHFQTAEPLRQLPKAAVAFQFDDSLARLPDSALTAGGDIMHDEIEFHRCEFVSLESARTIQTLFTTIELLGSSVRQLGIWGVFVLEHVIGLHCARLHTSTTTEEQLDALCRLARLLRQLLSLRRWTSALYVFTGIVKAFVEHSCTVTVDGRHHFAEVPENSPWPKNHVLTLLMAEMRMDPRQFCAFTVPVVFASIARASTPMPVDMRMRIASLLS
ncbi:hypothetical protein H4R20_006031 [Coemansia guatemalensis]|uniref:Uncharacterized protein n=1 Tax=Coemansia guatemalensis TaxID=2761395 RepID=A0A9W8HNJ0_9FUNG|nr:hypothetical protein H4R20_006031 [Coemansia guatemalensis]